RTSFKFQVGCLTFRNKPSYVFSHLYRETLSRFSCAASKVIINKTLMKCCFKDTIFFQISIRLILFDVISKIKWISRININSYIT
ncbi:hypothetical protein AAHB54_31880, partial [Bacillus cereus]